MSKGHVSETLFAVWAPRPRCVELRVDSATLPMVEVGDGWWVLRPDQLDALGRLPAGTRYGYLLDGQDRVLPDPRSRWQPDGVHEMSATVDPSSFDWTDGSWRGRELAGGVIYELHIGTLTDIGTLDSAIERLAHLVELGIDFVEVLPVNAFNGSRNWGYDGVLWYAVDDSYGGPEAYRRFVDACHSRGLAVIQDVVHNHLGPSGNYLPEFGPYLRDGSANTWGSSIDFDRDEVRRYVVENALMWMREYHVDGLRLDAVHALVDTRSPHILAELADRTHELEQQVGRPLTLIAESDLNDPRMITPTAAGGRGMDAQWSDDFHHAVHVALTGEVAGYYADFAPLDALAKVMTKGFFHDGTWSSFRERLHGRPIDVAGTPAWRLVVADQNHDQIGNRATGDRLSATMDHGGLAIAAVFMLASPFTPMLFMGEEWGATTPWQFFTAHPEPELGRATADGRIREFARMGWDPSTVPDPQAESTFLDSKLLWHELEQRRHAALLDLYRRLITARREHPALLDPSFARSVELVDDGVERWIVVRRAKGVTIAANLAESAVSVPAAGSVIVATDAGAVCVGDRLILPARSAAVVIATRPEVDDHPT